jgi:hypothetical protein
MALAVLADALDAAGQPDSAHRHAQQALRVLERVRDHHADLLRERLLGRHRGKG